MRRILGCFVIAVLLTGALATGASAFTSFSPPFTGGVDLVTGFTTCPPSGAPTGVLFDGNKLFVADVCDGRVYRFGPGGGTVASPEAGSPAPPANGA